MPKGSGKSKAKPGSQPTITAAMRRAPRSSRAKTTRVVEDSDENSEDLDYESEEVVETVQASRKRARTANTNSPVADMKPLFDSDYDEAEFSLTIEKRGDHIPFVWFNGICDYLETKAELFDASTEIGPKAGHLHVQAVVKMRCLTDDRSIKEIVKEMKTACNTRWGDGSKIQVCLKLLVAGQTLSRMIGYVHKDRNLATFRNKNKNVSEEMIAAGIEEHASPPTPMPQYFFSTP